LQDPRDAVRCESALTVGKMGAAAHDALPILIITISRQGDTPVCFEDTLAALAPTLPDAYPPMVELLASEHVDLRRKATHVLSLAGARPPETIQALLDVLSREPDRQVRAGVAKALQLPSIPDTDRMAVLTAALHDEETSVRLEAALAIRSSAHRGREA